MKRDSQRSKVYNWEDEYVLPHFGGKTEQMSLDECRALVERVYARYYCKPPKVRDGRAKTYAKGSFVCIDLPRNARNLGVVLHECAHGLAQYYSPPDEPPHGPTFVRLYMDLLSYFGNLPMRELRRTASITRLKVAPAGHCAAPNQNLIRRINDLYQREQSLLAEFRQVWGERVELEEQIRFNRRQRP